MLAFVASLTLFCLYGVCVVAYVLGYNRRSQ